MPVGNSIGNQVPGDRVLSNTCVTFILASHGTRRSTGKRGKEKERRRKGKKKKRVEGLRAHETGLFFDFRSDQNPGQMEEEREIEEEEGEKREKRNDRK